MKKIYLQEKITGVPGQYLMIDDNNNLIAGIPDNASYPSIIITTPDNCIGVDVYYEIDMTTPVSYKVGTTKRLSDNMWSSVVPNFGTWVVRATLNVGNQTAIIEENIDITTVKQYSVVITNN